MLLLFTVMRFDVFLCYIFSLHKLSFVLKTSQDNLITAQMYIRIREQLEYLFEDLFDKFVCLMESYIEWAFVFIVYKITSHIWILWCSGPTCSMAGCIYFWNYPNSPNHSISYETFNLLLRVSLVYAKSGILGKLGMADKFKRKRILINNMPMKQVQLIIHHSINCLLQNMHRNEVPRTINQQPTDFKKWFILNFDRQA